MAHPHTAIFINPETTSKVYTFFSGTTGLAVESVTTTDDAEPTIDALLSKVNALTDANQLVFIIPEGLTTSFVSKDQVDNFKTYVQSITTESHVIYTNTFLDNCLNRVNLATQPTQALMTNYVFQTTTDPSGLAIAGTKTNVAAVLTDAKTKLQPSASAKLAAVIKSGTRKAATSVPLLMPYDIGTIVDPTDTLRSYHCKIESTVGDDHNVENLGLFWFASGAAAVVLLVWLASYKLDKRSALVEKY